jgi:hypothetical protein
MQAEPPKGNGKIGESTIDVVEIQIVCQNRWRGNGHSGHEHGDVPKVTAVSNSEVTLVRGDTAAMRSPDDSSGWRILIHNFIQISL